MLTGLCMSYVAPEWGRAVGALHRVTSKDKARSNPKPDSNEKPTPLTPANRCSHSCIAGRAVAHGEVHDLVDMNNQNNHKTRQTWKMSRVVATEDPNLNSTMRQRSAYRKVTLKHRLTGSAAGFKPVSKYPFGGGDKKVLTPQQRPRAAM